MRWQQPDVDNVHRQKCISVARSVSPNLTEDVSSLFNRSIWIYENLHCFPSRRTIRGDLSICATSNWQMTRVVNKLRSPSRWTKRARARYRGMKPRNHRRANPRPEIDCRRWDYVVRFCEGIIAVFRVRRRKRYIDSRSRRQIFLRRDAIYTPASQIAFILRIVRSQDLRCPFVQGKPDYSILNRSNCWSFNNNNRVSLAEDSEWEF